MFQAFVDQLLVINTVHYVLLSTLKSLIDNIYGDKWMS